MNRMLVPWSTALRALPFTFVIYVLEAVLASFVALPAGVEVAALLRTSSWDASQWALLLEALPDLAALARTSALAGVLAWVLLGLLSPWLQMSWFASLEQPTTVSFAVARGSALVLRAWLVSLLVGLVMVLACAPVLAVAYAVHDGLSHSTDTKFHDLTLLATLVPLLPLLFLGHTLHDLARAGVLRGGAVAALRHGLRVALRLRVLLHSLAFGAAAAVLVLAAHALARSVGGSFQFVIAVVLLQSALLGRLFLRSAWLATALACMAPTPEPVAGTVPEGGER